MAETKINTNQLSGNLSGKKANINNSYGGIMSLDNTKLSLTPSRRDTSNLQSRVYFAPSEAINSSVFNEADSWKVQVKFKINGFQNSNYGTFATFGSLPLSGSVDNHIFSISFQKVDGFNGFVLFLSSNGTSWNLNEGTVDNQIGLTVGKTYTLQLEFTGSQYVFSGKEEDDADFTVMRTISSTSKVASISETQLFFGANGFIAGSTSNYQVYADYDLPNCYVEINSAETWRGATDITEEDNIKSIFDEIQDRLHYLENK